MVDTKTRMAGSGRTALFFNGHQIAWLDSFADSGQTPVGGGGGSPGMDIVHPLGKRHAQEVVTSRALNPGTLRCTIRELWNSRWWHQFRGLAGTRDIIEVWEAIAERQNPLNAAIVIRRKGQIVRGRQFHNLWPQPFDDGESGGEVTLGSLTVARTVTFVYLKRSNLEDGSSANARVAAGTAAGNPDDVPAEAQWVPDPDDPDNNLTPNFT